MIDDQAFLMMKDVRLVTQGSHSVVEVSKDLGVHENLLYKWRQKHLSETAHAFPGKGRLKPADEEIRRLKKELLDVKEERDIFKKAFASVSNHLR